MISSTQTTMRISELRWKEIFSGQIHLFAGGRSVLDVDMSAIEGLKVFINFAFVKFTDIDILIWGDGIVGDKLFEAFGTKPGYKLVCRKKHCGKSKDWIDECYDFPDGHFTLVWAIKWLRQKYPEKEIHIYGLDGDGVSYYDDVIEQPPIWSRMDAIDRCYEELKQIPKEKIKIIKK